MRSAAHLALLAMSAAGPSDLAPFPERFVRPRRDPHAYQTDEQRDAAKARAADKRAKKNARRLALRDLARLRSMQDAIARAEALHRYCSERGLALAGGEP